MSYMVYVQAFAHGEPLLVAFSSVVQILERFGVVTRNADRLEFTPNSVEICEIGFITGDQETGIQTLAFLRPVSGGRLAEMVFALLAIPGMCYFEQDGTDVLARADLTNEIPEGLLSLCRSGKVTVVVSPQEVPR